MAKKSMILFLAAVFLPSAVFARMPNDPEVQQWSFADTNAYEAWDLATGSRDVVVAVIDNGFDTFHPELAHNVWQNKDEIPDNGRDDDRNGYADDIWGWNFVEDNNDPRPSVFDLAQADIADGTLHHGTLVAGIIGAAANNNQFSAGLNWDVQLMNLKVVGNSGSIATARISEAIRYAVDNGAHIINISLIGPPEENLKSAVRYAYEKGVAVIAASGNDYSSLDAYPKYPICADEEGDTAEEWLLGVSAITESHMLAPFSNRGNCIDITAPGMHISSTLRYAPRYGLEKLYGGPFSGTSFAAPFVAGTAALVKSIHPEWGPKKIYETILNNAHKTPPADDGEYRRQFGAGLVQIDRAVAAAIAQATGFHALSDVVAYAPASGAVHPASFPVGPKGAKALAAYHLGTVRGFVGIFPKLLGRNEAVLFDESWRVTGRFPTPSGGAFSLAVGDVAGDAAPEIIVAPRFSSKTVFRVYTLSGAELRTVTNAVSHRGASVGLVENKQKKRFEVVAVADGHLYRYDDAFRVVKTIDLPHVKNTAPIGAGDIDGDGAQEYVVGSAPGEDPKLAYYEEDGRWLRTFYAYNGGYRGGLELIVGDYDADGRDDAVVAPSAGGQPVRVWTDRSKRLAEWWPFGSDSPRSMLLVGRQK